MYQVFIDGQAGTTGLQIADRLKEHDGVSVIEIDPADRKDSEKKRRIMEQADLAFLCLPDAPAVEAAAMAREANCKVIDASTVHRCADGWVYGLPELDSGQRARIAQADFVANPGCYPTGALLLLKPLMDSGVLAADSRVHITGYSGYSGGGKQMIESYEGGDQASACAVYGLNMDHKHVPEIVKWAGLSRRPSFIPTVVNVAQGMLVTICLDAAELKGGLSDLNGIYRDRYAGERFVGFDEAHQDFDGRFKYIEGLANTNACQISLYADEEIGQVLLMAKLDNLGKGASGAAVQNMNVMLGLPEETGVALF